MVEAARLKGVSYHTVSRAVRILAAADPALREAIERFQAAMAETVRAKDAAVRTRFP
jgi:phosphoribosylcarboxyaminoimidazole (NCAIR) mutase